MKWVFFAACALLAGASPPMQSSWSNNWRKQNPVWRGIHIICSNDGDLKTIADQLPALTGRGVNTLIIEVDYSFQYAKRPEMADPGGISKKVASEFAELCRKSGVRVIPQINVLGHQSWEAATGALLTKHPEFDETPGQYPGNKGIYCRSWCPQHPEVNKVVFDLVDELVDAFKADAFHVGMDEVFLIASEHCPRCKGGDPAKLFAKAVNDFHRHIVLKRKLEMFMWGDRLLDGAKTGYGGWEASLNNTPPAIDMIPKDIVVCDWHYTKLDKYPSVEILAQKGFRVWPSTWKDVAAAEAFSAYAKSLENNKVVGHLVTTWGAIPIKDLSAWDALVRPLAVWK